MSELLKALLVVVTVLVAITIAHQIARMLAKKCWLKGEELQKFQNKAFPWCRTQGVKNPKIVKQTVYGFCCPGFRKIEVAHWEERGTCMGNPAGYFTVGSYEICPKCGSPDFHCSM